MKRFIGLLAGAMLLSNAAHAWEASSRYTGAPLYRGEATQVESRPRFTLINFGPGTPTAFRFVRPGKWGSLSKEDAERVADAFMRGYASAENQRGRRQHDGKPYYFAQARFFLVSVDPDVMVVMPMQFVPGRGNIPLGPGLPSDLDYGAQMHRIWERLHAETGLAYLLARGEEPDWFNYVELTSIVPNADDLQVVAAPGAAPVPLRQALADPRFPLAAQADPRHPQLLRFTPR